MMNALRLVYLQYWLKFSCEETFTVHLVILKGLIVSPRSLDQTKHGSFQLLMWTFRIWNVIFSKWLWGLMCNGLWISPWIWIFCPIFEKNNLVMHNYVTHPKLLDGFNYEPKGEDNERRRSWGTLTGSYHFKSKTACWSFGMGLRRLISNSFTHTDVHKLNNKLVNA
jgi:hypothetical protein